MADADDGSVVCTAAGFLSFGRMITRDLVHSVGHSPVFKILLQTEVRTSPPALTNSADMLSTPADFTIFNA